MPGASSQFPQGLLPRDINPADGGSAKRRNRRSQRHLTLQPKAHRPDAPRALHRRPRISRACRASPTGTVDDAGIDELLTVDEVQLDQDIVAGTNDPDQRVRLDRNRGAAAGRGHELPGVDEAVHDPRTTAAISVETIRTLAQQWTAAGRPTPTTRRSPIEDHLRDPALFQYTLNPPQDPNSNIWPVVFFLTTSHKGYCQYFASAMGSMLRSLNIPTRLVSGYGPGTTRDPERTRGGPAPGRGDHQRCAQLGRGVLPRLRMDSLRAHAAVEPGQLSAVPARRGRGHRPRRPRRRPAKPVPTCQARQPERHRPHDRQHSAKLTPRFPRRWSIVARGARARSSC